MSNSIQKVGNFLKLLLNTTKEQSRALIYTLTPDQTRALCEIIFNLDKLPLTDKLSKELKKRKILFQRLSDKKLSLPKRLALIQTHYRQIRSTLEIVKSDVLALLE